MVWDFFFQFLSFFKIPVVQIFLALQIALTILLTNTLESD